jgi:hypothetical protein
MRAGGGDGEGPLGGFLAADLGKVHVVERRLAEHLVDVDTRGLERQAIGEEADGLGQRADADDLDVVAPRRPRVRCREAG